MKNGSFTGRRLELEEEFFLKRDMELLQALREKTASKKRKQALADALGVGHDELIDQLIELDVSSETVAALSLVPLISVAWADGTIDAKERAAVLDAAEKQGIEKEHPAYQLLEGWLKQKPDAKLLTAWKSQVAALCESLDETAKQELKDDLLGRARTVAETAGGLLGFGNKVSKSEQVVLSDLERAFD